MMISIVFIFAIASFSVDNHTFQEEECCICLSAKPKYVLRPCGHFCICRECIKRRLVCCPLCVQPIKEKELYEETQAPPISHKVTHRSIRQQMAVELQQQGLEMTLSLFTCSDVNEKTAYRVDDFFKKYFGLSLVKQALKYSNYEPNSVLVCNLLIIATELIEDLQSNPRNSRFPKNYSFQSHKLDLLESVFLLAQKQVQTTLEHWDNETEPLRTHRITYITDVRNACKKRYREMCNLEGKIDRFKVIKEIPNSIYKDMETLLQ